MNSVLSFLQSVPGILSSVPLIPAILVSIGSVGVFLILYATRDILLRTNSFLYQFVCILLVALVPGLGFLLYLLIRPSRTVREKEMHDMLYFAMDKLELLEQALGVTQPGAPEIHQPDTEENTEIKED
jgi:hypothetical protein